MSASANKSGPIISAAGRKLSNYFCHFPLGAVYQNIRKFQCLGKCQEDPMCTGINFRLYEGEDEVDKGECVTVAPNATGQSLRAEVLMKNKTDWEYYGLTRN